MGLPFSVQIISNVYTYHYDEISTENSFNKLIWLLSSRSVVRTPLSPGGALFRGDDDR